MRAYQRFLEYAQIWTSSERDSDQTPSSMRQFDLAHQLAFELRELGLEHVEVDNHCVVYAQLPPTPGLEHCPCVGLMAHMDTHPDFVGRDVKPQIIEDYDGGDVSLGESGLVLSPREFKHLPSLAGQTLITTQGDTLLGADDKAGVAEIMTALEAVVQSGRPHGQVSVAFIPDEEIGKGIAHFDLAKFAAPYAYIVDGWEVGEIGIETFNAVQACVAFQGLDTHTGQAKGIMRNAQLIALEFAGMIPPDEIPARTEGREGFFHLLHMEGAVQRAELVYNLRDFTSEGIQRRKHILLRCAAELNTRYGQETVAVSFTEGYHNIKTILDQYPQLVSKAENACRQAGIPPKTIITRGGTCGARLSKSGLPCPSLGTGGWAYHSLHEHITVEAMDQVSRILEELIYQFSEAALN